MKRKLDDLGRVVLPCDYRRRMGLQRGDWLEVHVEHNAVVIRKTMRRCVFCGETRIERLKSLNSVDLCDDCAAKIGGGL